jgi:hypothetical protein
MYSPTVFVRYGISGRLSGFVNTRNLESIEVTRGGWRTLFNFRHDEKAYPEDAMDNGSQKKELKLLYLIGLLALFLLGKDTNVINVIQMAMF